MIKKLKEHDIIDPKTDKVVGKKTTVVLQKKATCNTISNKDWLKKNQKLLSGMFKITLEHEKM